MALVAIGMTTYFGLSAWWAPSAERTAAAAPSGARSVPTSRSTTSTTSTTHAATTTTVHPGAPVVEHDGRRYEIGTAGDIVLVGPWRCDGRDLPVVLHPDDGTVHLFTGWAGDGGSIAARTVASVPGADGLRAAADGTGCSVLLVTDADQVLATLTTEELR